MKKLEDPQIKIIGKVERKRSEGSEEEPTFHDQVTISESTSKANRINRSEEAKRDVNLGKVLQNRKSPKQTRTSRKGNDNGEHSPKLH